jgi:polar amino acid transport system substrate-binding protein
MRTRVLQVIALLALLLTMAACTAPVAAPAGEAAATEGGSESTVASDLLAEVQARGKLIVSSDPAYPPQSELVANVDPPAETKCTGDEKPANQFTGFDVDVAAEIAKRLGVEVCFVTPDWTLITAGGWAGRWDLSIGSMTITPERMENLYFTQPYYTTPAAFFVHQDNTTFAQPADLSGKKIGVCTGCTYEAFLDGSLSIPGETIEFVVSDAEVVGYDTDVPALEDLALGDGVRLDAVLTALPTGQPAILPTAARSDNWASRSISNTWPAPSTSHRRATARPSATPSARRSRKHTPTARSRRFQKSITGQIWPARLRSSIWRRWRNRRIV